MTKELASLELIEETEFNRAWCKILRKILEGGKLVTFKSNMGRVEVYDTVQVIPLTGYALTQIHNVEVHPQYPYSSTVSFSKEWSREFWEKKYLPLSKDQRPRYLAFDRLVNYPAGEGKSIDRLAWMRKSLSSQIAEEAAVNDCQAITWIPETDLPSEVTPYIQRIWMRVYPNLTVDVHIIWRATDAYNLWQSRVIAVANMLERELIRPNKCRTARIINYYDSLFIKKTNEAAAREVQSIAVNPRNVYE
jgi:hypothetical protein